MSIFYLYIIILSIIIDNIISSGYTYLLKTKTKKQHIKNSKQEKI